MWRQYSGGKVMGNSEGSGRIAGWIDLIQPYPPWKYLLVLLEETVRPLSDLLVAT